VITRSRLGLRLVVVVALACAVLLPFGGTAYAIGPDCKDAPAVVAPGSLIGGDPAQEATGHSPFDPNPDTTVYREYGLVPPAWSTYDLGCGLGGDFVKDPAAVFWTALGSGALGLPTVFVGGTVSALAHAVLGWTGIDAIDEVLGSVSTQLRDTVWIAAVPVVLLFVLLWWFVVLLRGDSKRLTSATVYIVCAVFLFALMVGFPAKAAGYFDQLMRSAVVTAFTPASGIDTSGAVTKDEGKAASDAIVGTLYATASYRTWCWGMVGTDHEVGDKYCWPLWQATHFSRQEVATGQNRKADAERKQAQFKDIADKIQENHPGAYPVLQGKAGFTRVTAGFAALLLWLLLGFFPLWGLGMVFLSLLIFRLAIAVAPAIGPLFLHPGMARAAKSTGNFLFGGLVNAVIFTFATSVFLTVAATLVDLGQGGLDLPLRFALLLIVTIALWFLTTPWRRLTAMGTTAQTGHSRDALWAGISYGRARQARKLDDRAKAAQVATGQNTGRIEEHAGNTAQATQLTAISAARTSLNSGALVQHAENMADDVERLVDNTRRAAENTKRAADSSEEVARSSQTIVEGTQHVAANTQRAVAHTLRIAENTEPLDEGEGEDPDDEYYTRRRRGRS
jgi:hypothetical protein